MFALLYLEHEMHLLEHLWSVEEERLSEQLLLGWLWLVEEGRLSEQLLFERLWSVEVALLSEQQSMVVLSLYDDTFNFEIF